MKISSLASAYLSHYVFFLCVFKWFAFTLWVIFLLRISEHVVKIWSTLWWKSTDNARLFSVGHLILQVGWHEESFVGNWIICLKFILDNNRRVWHRREGVGLIKEMCIKWGLIKELSRERANRGWRERKFEYVYCICLCVITYASLYLFILFSFHSVRHLIRMHVQMQCHTYPVIPLGIHAVVMDWETHNWEAIVLVGHNVYTII